ncbi:hypothetical protein ADL22_16745 [Streptomyces sp. NRRL F-4489]|uniref:DUF6345 domain-containing protein n=1 Tax=Streptomyces sp. NRRL F-4489 TaxID=1609095 RepID=UPI000748055B|nr:DUF6345 domain-containing protein [Streptomyces sp. NRRL F-4489]KUL38897.1 hypothetical protein ADL22_16745 [Streptomyces sp. NRRL F-4489]
MSAEEQQHLIPRPRFWPSVPVATDPLFEPGITGGYVGAFSVTRSLCAPDDDLEYPGPEVDALAASLRVPLTFSFKDAEVYGVLYHDPGRPNGIDTNVVSYHAGHGGTDDEGVYAAILYHQGDCGAYSDLMAIGARRCRYVFWSTCNSTLIKGPYTPWRTWRPANHGFRMIFGYETSCSDDPGYGAAFVRNARWGFCFSVAFLLAAWDADPGQIPVATACGAEPPETHERLWREKVFSAEAVDPEVWEWVSLEEVARLHEPNLVYPPTLQIAVLDPGFAFPPAALARRFAIDPETLHLEDSRLVAADGGRRLTMEQSGRWCVHLAELADHIEYGGPQLPDEQALALAEQALREFDLPLSLYRAERIAHLYEDTSRVSIPPPYRPAHRATLVEFRQLIEHLPVVTPDAGTFQVIVAADGTVTSIVSSFRRVMGMSDQPVSGPPPIGLPDPEEALQRELQLLLERLDFDADRLGAVTVVPGTSEIGYDIQGNHAVLVAQRRVELTSSNGVTKRHLLKAVLYG